MSAQDGQPRRRGGRVVDKATPEQVMALARNLPLTHSVLGKAIENATPGQLGFLANLFEAENASRAESKRRRLLKQAGFPQNKTLDGYDWSMASFPSDWGREQLASLEFIDRAEDLVLYGDVGCGKTHMAVATWKRSWDRFVPFLQFPPMLRRVVYTTNSIESLNYQLRKVSRNRSQFPNDQAVVKLFWLAICDIEDKRSLKRTKNGNKTRRKSEGRLIEGRMTTNWKQALAQLAAAYPERMEPYL